MEENHYYPFGLKHQKYTNALPKDILADETETTKALIDINPNNPVLNIYSNYDYKYNYQEWQDEHALNMYAMDFRNYDPTIGRFHNPDLLAELNPDLSPYRFAFNNPVIFNDPTGLYEGDGGPGDFEVDFFFNENGDYFSFDFLGFEFKINTPEGGPDPEGEGINYAGEDNAEFADFEAPTEDCCPNDRPFGSPDFNQQTQPAQQYLHVGKGDVIALGEGGVLEYVGIGGLGIFKWGMKSIPKLFKTSKVAKTILTIGDDVLSKFTQHAFAKGRHADLGLSVETMASKGYNLVKQNSSKLAVGDNTIHVTINGIQKTIMANVNNGTVRSINMYSGVSNRVTQGKVINLGKVKW